MDFRTGKPVNTALDWTGHGTISTNQRATSFLGPKPVQFVSKTMKMSIPVGGAYSLQCPHLSPPQRSFLVIESSL